MAVRKDESPFHDAVGDHSTLRHLRRRVVRLPHDNEPKSRTSYVLLMVETLADLKREA
jgi:hypothetical protein